MRRLAYLALALAVLAVPAGCVREDYGRIQPPPPIVDGGYQPPYEPPYQPPHQPGEPPLGPGEYPAPPPPEGTFPPASPSQPPITGQPEQPPEGPVEEPSGETDGHPITVGMTRAEVAAILREMDDPPEAIGENNLVRYHRRPTDTWPGYWTVTYKRDISGTERVVSVGRAQIVISK